MELESLVVIRRIFAKHLPALLTPMGIAVTRHISTILRVCEDYLSVYDGPQEEARLLALKILECIIKQCWPRMTHHSQYIINMLLKLMYDATMDKTLTPEEVNCHLVAEATNCLLWLSRCTEDVVTSQLKSVLECDLPPELIKCYRDCLQKVSAQSWQEK